MTSGGASAQHNVAVHVVMSIEHNGLPRSDPALRFEPTDMAIAIEFASHCLAMGRHLHLHRTLDRAVSPRKVRDQHARTHEVGRSANGDLAAGHIDIDRVTPFA